jgi:hypothetical protein
MPCAVENSGFTGGEIMAGGDAYLKRKNDKRARMPVLL